MILGGKDLQNKSDLSHRKKSSVLSGAENFKIIKKSPNGTIESSIKKDQSSSSEDDEYGEQYRKPAKLPLFLRDLTEEKLKTMIDALVLPMKDSLGEFQFFLQETKTQMIQLQMKLSHDPLLKMIDRNRLLIEEITVDVKKLKDDTGKSNLLHTIQKIEVTQAVAKNDLQQ